jgi:menaquinone-dependent protoporphyrinogen IX oxidase
MSKYITDREKKKYVINLIEVHYSYFQNRYKQFLSRLQKFLENRSDNNFKILSSYRSKTFKPFVSSFFNYVVSNFDMINDMIQNPVLWYNFKGVFTFHVKSIVYSEFSDFSLS